MENSPREEFRLSRPRIIDNEAAMFVENKIVLTGQQSPVYAAQLDRFVSVEEGFKQQEISKDLWIAADDEKKKLFELMGAVQVKISKKSKSRYQPLDLRGCTWEEVMSEIQETSQRWKGLPGKSKGRKCLEVLGHDSGAFQAWLGLLPAGDYGSSICGVFKLAIGAANRYVEVEDSIFETLSELPEIMEGARKYVQIYRDHPEHLLERKTFDLYLSILKCLTHIMQFFADSSTKKFLEPITRQKTYKNAFTLSLEEVKKNASRIKDEAQQCLASRNAKIDKNVEFLLDDVDSLPERISEKIFQRLYLLMRSSSQQFNTREVTQPSDESLKLDMTVNELKIKENAIHASDATTPAKLLDLLQYDAKLVSQDLDTFRDIDEKLDDTGKSRAAAMVTSDKLREWLIGDAFSSPLLVNGHCDLEAAEGPSPLSCVDVQLVKFFQQSHQALVITYFCSQHREVDHRSRGSPTATMMASLVFQLLNHMIDRGIEVELSFLTKTDLRNVERMKLEILCILFREITLQLPPNTVLLCVLDELAMYETASLERETDAIVRRLMRLVAKSETVFKLLITCRGRSLEFQKHFGAEHILDLPVEIEVDDAAMWRITNIKMK